MKSDKQAHTYGSNFSDFESPSKSNNGENSTLSGDVPLEEAIDDFKLMAKVDGRAEKTLNLYEYVFGRFRDGDISQDCSVENIETKDIRKYSASLMEDGLKNTSVAIHHRVLKAFFNWLVEEEYLNTAPTDKINKPKTPNKFPKV